MLINDLFFMLDLNSRVIKYKEASDYRTFSMYLVIIIHFLLLYSSNNNFHTPLVVLKYV